MSRRLRYPVPALLIAAATALAADPPPLVKPSPAPGGLTRVRFPLEGGENGALYRLKAIVPKPKAKGQKAKATDDGAPATVGLDTVLPNGGYVTAKTAARWGYATPAGESLVLPELVLVGQTVGGKGKPPAEVHVRAVNVKLNVIPSAYGSDTQIAGADLMVNLDALLKAPPTQSQPWVVFTGSPALLANFPDRVTPKAVTSEAHAEEPPKPPDPGRVPVMITLRPGTHVVPVAGLNGKPAAAMTPGGPMYVFNLSGVAPPGVVVTRTLAALHDLKPDPEAKDLNVFADFAKKGKMVPGKVKDLRVAVGSGTGFRPGKELAVKDQGVTIDLEQTAPVLFVGPAFVKEHLQSPVLAVGPDGVPRLYGWAKPAEVADPPKPKKP